MFIINIQICRVSSGRGAISACEQQKKLEEATMKLENCKETDSESIETERLTMTVAELADTLQVSLPTAYTIARSDGFPAVRIGKRMLINRARVQDWLDNQNTDG